MIKVVIVEDEEKTRDLIKLMINWNELGYTIIGEASNGKEALELVRGRTPDLLITDIKMPIMDGIELSRQIATEYPKIRMVFLTAYEEFEYAKMAIKMGVLGYLTKPLVRSELKELLMTIKPKIPETKTPENAVSALHVTNQTVEEVLDYMAEHYSDPSLSLTGIAKELFINSSYLCRIFKQQVGINFIDYLTKLRIDKAVEYLDNTNKMAYEIASLVGIPDADYFGKCFKKQIGMSIKDYKTRRSIIY